MDDTSDSIRTTLRSRRGVICRLVGAGTLAVTGVGAVAADHGSRGGNSGGGGPPEGHGPEGDRGGGPTKEMGGWGLSTDDPAPETQFSLTEGGGDALQHVMGCDSAGETNVPSKDFDPYDADFGTLFIYTKRPVVTGEDTAYAVVNSDTCSTVDGTTYNKIDFEPLHEVA